jgi:hypothetical protein
MRAGVLTSLNREKILKETTMSPSVSRAQQRLMQIAEHHPDKLYAKNKGVAKMSHEQLHDFAAGSEKGKPEHVRKKPDGDRLGSGSHGFRSHKQ